MNKRAGNRYARAAAVFAFFAVVASVYTGLVYAMLYVMLTWIGILFDLPGRFDWWPLAATALVFLLCLLTAIRQRIPDITRLKWDSGTREDAPSRINLRGYGGRLWNVNPLGPQTITSFASVVSAFLCGGPSVLVTAFIAAAEQLRAGQGSPDDRGHGE